MFQIVSCKQENMYEEFIVWNTYEYVYDVTRFIEKSKDAQGIPSRVPFLEYEGISYR